MTNTPYLISGSEASAWVASIAGAVALILQGASALRKRRKERDEIDVALDRQPQVRQQLELGNVGEAVRHLNAIINSQANHIQAQEERMTSCDERIENLTLRNEALETECRNWELRYEEVSTRLHEIEEKYTKKINELERNYARSLAILQQRARGETE